MKINCCQTVTRGRDKTLRPPSRWRRFSEFAGWIFPTATLILLPKCPICVAADLALLSGVGISITSASILRTSLLTLCIATLLGLALWRLRRLAARSTVYSMARPEPATENTEGQDKK